MKISTVSRNRMEELKEVAQKIDQAEYPLLGSPSEIVTWLASNIKYKEDIQGEKKEDYWQSPEETIILQSGDCEDYSFLVEAFLDQMGIESSVIVVNYTKSGKPAAHAFIVFPKKKPYQCLTPYKLRNMDKGLIAYVNSKYPSWENLYVIDYSRKRWNKILKNGDTLTWVNQRENSKIIKDLLGK